MAASASSAQSPIESRPEEWDLHADDYDTAFTRLFQPFASAAYQYLISPSLPPSSPISSTFSASFPPTASPLRILDIGCGGGAFSLPAFLAGHSVMAIDYSPKMISALEKRKQSIIDNKGEGVLHSALMDAHQLSPLYHSSLPPLYDGAVLLFSLMFFSNPSLAITQLSSVVKDGGRAVTLTWGSMKEIEWIKRNNRAILKVKPELLAEKKDEGKGNEGDGQLVERYNNPVLLEKLFKENGFRSVSVYPITGALDLSSIDGMDASVFWHCLTNAFPPIRHLFETKLKMDERKMIEKAFVEEIEKDFHSTKNVQLSAKAWITVAAK